MISHAITGNDLICHTYYLICVWFVKLKLKRHVENSVLCFYIT